MSTLFVAAYNSDSRSKRQADYICDGQNDSQQIANALVDLPVGGVLQLSEGDFMLSESLVYPAKCVHVVGQGALACDENNQATKMHFAFSEIADCVIFTPQCVGQSLREIALIGDGENTRYGILLQGGAAFKSANFVHITEMASAGVRGDSGNSQNYFERVLTRDLVRGFWMYGNNNTYVACQSMRAAALGCTDSDWGFSSQESSSMYMNCMAENFTIGFAVTSWAQAVTLQSCHAEKCGSGLVIYGSLPSPIETRVYGFSSVMSCHSQNGAVRVMASQQTQLRDLYVVDSESTVGVEVGADARTVVIQGGTLNDATPINGQLEHVRCQNVGCQGEWLDSTILAYCWLDGLL